MTGHIFKCTKKCYFENKEMKKNFKSILKEMLRFSFTKINVFLQTMLLV